MLTRLQRAEPVFIGCLMLLGLYLRLSGVFSFTTFVDEPASMLAIEVVAAKGVPVLPSGVVYLQGMTLSYLLAPLAWLGFQGIGDLWVFRLSSLVFGMGVLVAVWRLAFEVSHSRRIALFSLLLVAVDPVSVQWAALLRPYALLQLLTVLMVLYFLRLLDPERAPARTDLFVAAALFGIGTFTHIGSAMIWGSLGLLAVALLNKRLLTTHWQVGLAWAMGGLSIAVFLVINSVFGVTSAAETDVASSVGFVGNHVLSLDSLMKPRLQAWGRLYQTTGVRNLLPPVIGFGFGVALARARRGREARGIGVLAGVTIIGVAAVSLLTRGIESRYVLHVHTLELIVFAFGVMWEDKEHPSSLLLGLLRGMVGMGLVIALMNGTYNRRKKPVLSPAFDDVIPELVRLHTGDDPVIVALPPILAIAAPSLRERMVFLAGKAGSARAARYTHGTPPRDFWMGAPSIVTVNGLCDVIKEHPRSWILVDVPRLVDPRVFKGRLAKIIREGSERVAVGREGARLRRFTPAGVERVCGRGFFPGTAGRR